jgi:hypothetical protein
MSGKKSILFVAACCAALVAPLLSAQAQACEANPGRAPIRVSIGADGTPAVSAESVTACEGETLRWVFQGTDAREFSVLFVGAEDSPFDWDRQTGSTVTGTVKPGAAKGGKRTEYKYDVEVDGNVLDPRIIVDP